MGFSGVWRLIFFFQTEGKEGKGEGLVMINRGRKLYVSPNKNVLNITFLTCVWVSGDTEVGVFRCCI